MLLHSQITKSDSKSVLVILHGFLGSSDNWKTLALEYAKIGFEVHAIDLRNHGKSFHSPDFSYEIMSQDILDYCNEHQLSKISLLGHSMGGKVAMEFATSQPDCVEKLIIADIGPKFYAPHHQDILAGLNAVDFSQKPSRAQVEQVLIPYIADFGTRQFLMKNLYWQSPDQLAFRFNLEVLNQKINEIGRALNENARFQNPTLFIHGGKSNYILDEDLPEIRKYFPNLQLFTIADVGHWLHAENPHLFFQQTARFLTNQQTKLIILYLKMKLITRLFLTAMLVVIISYLPIGAHVDGVLTALKVAVVLGLLNVFVKPVLVLLTFPITLITLGLFLLVINALMILACDHFIEGFKIDSFWNALFFSIILSISQSIVYRLTEDKK